LKGRATACVLPGCSRHGLCARSVLCCQHILSKTCFEELVHISACMQTTAFESPTLIQKSADLLKLLVWLGAGGAHHLQAHVSKDVMTISDLVTIFNATAADCSTCMCTFTALPEGRGVCVSYYWKRIGVHAVCHCRLYSCRSCYIRVEASIHFKSLIVHPTC
jgi:hypothetical protein